MPLVPWRCFRKLKDKPYPRNRYNRSVPDPKIKIHNTGNRKAHVDLFPACFQLYIKSKCRVSSEALEAGRVACNKLLTQSIGKSEFHQVIHKYPHDACRNNKMLSCAGADRLQSGMRKSFGKCTRRAARIQNNDHIISIRTNYKHRKAVHRALLSANLKFPNGAYVIESPNWGFTDVPREEYAKMRADRKIAPMGTSLAHIKTKGPLADYFEKLVSIKQPNAQLPAVSKVNTCHNDLLRTFRNFKIVPATA
ncbi:MAG: hypothetical protein MHMPM18_005177 [Marteilia pararefringens]